MIEHPLAQPDGLGSDLHQLVVVDELERRLQGQHPRRRQEQLLVGGGGADVGQLLGLPGVDHDVVLAAVHADDLAVVHLYPGPQEQRPAILKVEQGIGVGLARLLGDEHAVRARPEGAGVGP